MNAKKASIQSSKSGWKFLRLAFCIQTGPRHLASKLILLFLANSAKDDGRSCHGYRSISASCNGLSTNAIREALLHLRDDLHIVSWVPGSGGANKKSTNSYTLHFEAMKDLVCAQGVFDSETLKRKRDDITSDEEQSMHPRQVESMHPRQITVDASEISVDASESSVNASEMVGRCIPDKHNPKRTPTYKHQEGTLAPGPVFCTNSSLVGRQVGQPPATRPPVAPSPQGGVLNSPPIKYGDPLPGLIWSEERNLYFHPVSRKEVPVMEVDNRIAFLNAKELN